MKSLVLCCGLISALLLSSTAQVEGQSGQSPSHQGTDCTQIHSRNPAAPSGVYVIKPVGVKNTFQVYCEMQTDGGWTVLQRRSGRDVSFHRNWTEYKDGFGDLMQNHWLGLSKVFSMTQKKTWTLRVDLYTHDGRTLYALYKNFRVGDETSGFKLHVGEYDGNAGDALQDQNGYGFSTSDRDNDGCSPCIFGDIAWYKCVGSKEGWWYSQCGSASLNGDWHASGDHIGWSSGLYWRTDKFPKLYSVKGSKMMIKSCLKNFVAKHFIRGHTVV
ncbi:hypothetical protein JOB18_048700 [Solea senegalensis]|uniref:Fibrinogen C-terminal domain-containing protein n=2 Tax=Solea senegalensis TaxID=28829 RepID=A0AAV6R062_SOLSE|nr:hypothetical protein JOB18_048700 [Solea senegalensis]